jgi:hypothetical protein
MVTPQPATAEQLLGELVLHLLGVPRGLVFQTHRPFHRPDLAVGKFTGAIADDGTR